MISFRVRMDIRLISLAATVALLMNEYNRQQFIYFPIPVRF